MPIIGSALKFRIGPLLDDSETAITGATWALVKAMKPDDSSFSVTYAENGGGFYTALTTAITDQTGVWALASQAMVNGVIYSDASELDVLPDTGMTPTRAAKLDSLGAGSVTVQSPVTQTGDVTLYQRNDYAATEARSLDWTTTVDGQWPDLTGASIVFVARPSTGEPGEGVYALGSVITPTGAQHVRVEITAAATRNAKPGSQTYQVRATLGNGDIITLATGQAKIIGYLGN